MYLQSKTLTMYSGYQEAEIMPCVHAMQQVLVASATSKYQAVRTKFASSKMMSISTHAVVEAYIAAHSKDLL